MPLPLAGRCLQSPTEPCSIYNNRLRFCSPAYYQPIQARITIYSLLNDEGGDGKGIQCVIDNGASVYTSFQNCFVTNLIYFDIYMFSPSKASTQSLLYTEVIPVSGNLSFILNHSTLAPFFILLFTPISASGVDPEKLQPSLYGIHGLQPALFLGGHPCRLTPCDLALVLIVPFYPRSVKCNFF